MINKSDRWAIIQNFKTRELYGVRVTHLHGLTIGRGGQCDIRIESDEVAPLHAMLCRYYHHWFLTSIEGALTNFRGEALTSPGSHFRVSGLGDPVPFHIGSYSITITDNADLLSLFNDLSSVGSLAPTISFKCAVQYIHDIAAILSR